MNVWKIILLYILCLIQFSNLVLSQDDNPWSEWSQCTKTCGIGTRNRNRNNGTETESQYCNPKYCPDIIKRCNLSSTTECYSDSRSFGECVNGTCRCTLSRPGSGEYNYNEYNCFPEYDNCIIRVEPPTAVGYIDPQQKTSSSSELYSCTTADNNINEVHIIGIHGDRYYDSYMVTILPRGPVTKPIILVLISYEQTNWIINSSVDLTEVLYGGFNAVTSTVKYNSTFRCTYPNPKRRDDLKSGFGSDIGGGYTLHLLKTIGQEFGPITSFTGYYYININPFANIILNVGGDPLSVIPKEYTYNLSMSKCNPWFPKCKYPYTASDQTWSQWSPCSKSCGIGLRVREICNNTGYLIKKEEKYCNLQYCPDIKQACNSSFVLECYYATGSSGKCVNGTCQCTLSGSGPGYSYNKYNCFPEYGNCSIRIEPPSALGYRDPKQKPLSNYRLHSCTTADNKINEVHIIGIYGDRYYDSYMVTILPRGPVTKPIILVLTSYEQTNWIINSSVDLTEVLYGGYYAEYSTVKYNSTFSCTYPIPKRRTDLKFGSGSDTGGGDTLHLLKMIGQEFGPITTFTGYYEININPFANIILKVGGDPLSVIPREYIYNISMAKCNPWFPKCKYPYTASDQTWSEWSPCSKSCGLGLRVREICNSTGYLIKKEEMYCNMQYCPDIGQTCNSSFIMECYDATSSRGKCINGTCQCTLSGTGPGYSYNKYNCFPEYGNCSIRIEPPSALGYRDPRQKPVSYYKLHSCTTDDNKVNEVHIIGIYGSRTYDNYKITILPRGPVTKPVVLILVSYEPTNWIIESSVDLTEVLYGGYFSESSTVKYDSTFSCTYPVPKRRPQLRSGYGSDTGGGDTLQVLRKIGDEFGPITSFTGYYEINVNPFANIILKVGGHPLSVIPKEYIYNLSMVQCNPLSTRCINTNTDSDQTWGQWSPCSKSCDIGTRFRESCNGAGYLIKKEEEYCNIQFCPVSDTYRCTTILDCNYGLECISNKCQCNKGEHYNKNNCNPQYGDCIIRRNPPTSLGYKDPDMHYTSLNTLYSCTTHGNAVNEVHVIGIYGSKLEYEYMISILPRGPITKPLILVLVAYFPTYWKINTTVDLTEVLYGGYRVDSSYVESTSSSRCLFIAKKRWTLGRYGYGYDMNDGNTIDILKDISTEYGAITSFTGYHHLRANPVSHIILKVGGNPLEVIPRNHTYNLSMVRCTVEAVSEQFCKNKNTANDQSWGQWTSCSKSCDIGTRTRERCNSTRHLLEKEEEFCNLQYCPDDWSFCDHTSSIKCVSDYKAECINGKCYLEFGNCIMREHSPTALSYKDPKLYYIHKTCHLSCVSNENKNKEIHVIAIEGSFDYNTLQITILPRGPIKKPIILVLGSYVQTRWKINTPVDIEEIVYTGNRHANSSTVERSGNYDCYFRATRRFDIPSWYGSDSDMIQLLTLATAEYGPITSFSSFNSIRADPFPNIILNVGGNPLAVLPKNFNYSSSENICTSSRKWETTCTSRNMNQNNQNEITWMEWTRCSKMCNDGTRVREKCNETGHVVRREEQYCNMEPCQIETKKTCYQHKSSCWFIDSKSDTGKCIDGTCYCILGEEYVTNNCFPRYGNCIIKPNPLSALGYKDPDVTYGYPIKPLYSCTSSDNPIYDVHIIAIAGLTPSSIWHSNHYNISVIANGPVTKPIVLILTSSADTVWKINSQVGIHRIIHGGKNNIYTSVHKESGCDVPIYKYKIDEFGYGEDSRQQETLTLLKKVSSLYGPITSFTGYEFLKTDRNIPRIILNVGGDPLQVLSKRNTYRNCSRLKPPEYPVFPTIRPISRPGTIKIVPFGKYAIHNQGYLKLDCFYTSYGPLTGKEKIFLFGKNFEFLSKIFTVTNSADNVSLNLTATAQITTADEGTYTCMEMSSGISASVEVLIADFGPVATWNEWSTCSKSCGIGMRNRIGYNRDNQVAESQSQYCNLQYCPDKAKKCYWNYCDPDVEDVFCIYGVHNYKNCYPYYGDCVIREDPPISLGYRDPTTTEMSNLYSCITKGNSRNEVHVIGIYGDSNTKDYTVDIYVRGPVTKPLILVLASFHNTHWKINTSVDISKILYFDDDRYPSTVNKLSSSRCGFSTESRIGWDIGFGYDRNGGNTMKMIKSISDEFGSITSFTGYLHLRPSSLLTPSHIILNVGGDPLSVTPQKYVDKECRPTGSSNDSQPQNDRTYLVAVILPCIAVGVFLVVCIYCVCKRIRNTNQRELNRQRPSSVPSSVVQQDNETNSQQRYVLSDTVSPSAPPPTYNQAHFQPSSEDSPPSYETVMRDYQKETYM